MSWRSTACQQEKNHKMAPSKRCETASDRRCNSLDVRLLSTVRHHHTKQENGKSITAGARNKSNTQASAEASHQGEYAEDMLMVRTPTVEAGWPDVLHRDLIVAEGERQGEGSR